MRILVLHFQCFWARKLLFPNPKIFWFIGLRYCNNHPVSTCTEVLYRMRFHASPWETERRYIPYTMVTSARRRSTLQRHRMLTRIVFLCMYSYYIYFTFFFLFCGKWKRHELYSRRWYDWLEFIRLAIVYYTTWRDDWSRDHTFLSPSWWSIPRRREHHQNKSYFFPMIAKNYSSPHSAYILAFSKHRFGSTL